MIPLIRHVFEAVNLVVPGKRKHNTSLKIIIVIMVLVLVAMMMTSHKYYK